MLIADMMKPNGRVYLKSEWEPISDRWPVVSYSKEAVGRRLRRDFVPGRDVLLYVGTTSPETTKNPDHRSRILSAIVVQPGQDLETKKMVPAAVWLAENKDGKEQWKHSLAPRRSANCLGPPFPDVYEIAPDAYRALGETVNRGGLVEVVGDERAAAMALPVEEIALTLSDDARRYIAMVDTVASPGLDLAVRQEISRMVDLIIRRVEQGGEIKIGINPIRHAPNASDLNVLLMQIWKEKGGRCAICDRPIVLNAVNRLLSPSVDRIDSANTGYVNGNVQVTHVACNWAKNQFGTSDVVDWLNVVRAGGGPAENEP